MSGVAEAYSFMVFLREIPLNYYIQAIPEMTLFIHNVSVYLVLSHIDNLFMTHFSDVLSFYKEELVGEATNQVSTLAARTKNSKLETFGGLTKTMMDFCKRVVRILEGSPESCEAFKHYTAGYVYFYTSISRYRLKDLNP